MREARARVQGRGTQFGHGLIWSKWHAGSATACGVPRPPWLALRRLDKMVRPNLCPTYRVDDGRLQKKQPAAHRLDQEAHC